MTSIDMDEVKRKIIELRRLQNAMPSHELHSHIDKMHVYIMESGNAVKRDEWFRILNALKDLEEHYALQQRAEKCNEEGMCRYRDVPCSAYCGYWYNRMHHAKYERKDLE